MKLGQRTILTALLTFFLFLPGGAQLPDFKASHPKSKPYSAKWTQWVRSGLSEAEMIQKMSADFKVLAYEDFTAACTALLQTNVITNEQIIKVS